MNITLRMSAEGVRRAGFPKHAQRLEYAADLVGEPPLTKEQEEYVIKASLETIDNPALGEIEAAAKPIRQLFQTKILKEKDLRESKNVAKRFHLLLAGMNRDNIDSELLSILRIIKSRIDGLE